MTADTALLELLRPLVSRVVSETLSRIADADPSLADGRLALSEKEAATAIGVEKSTLARLRYEGRVKATKLGRSWSYSIAELKRLLADQ